MLFSASQIELQLIFVHPVREQVIRGGPRRVVTFKADVLSPPCTHTSGACATTTEESHHQGPTTLQYKTSCNFLSAEKKRGR